MNDKELRKLGIHIKSIYDVESDYHEFITHISEKQVDLARWHAPLAGYVEPCVPGELVLVLAETGAGKSGLLQNIAQALRPQTVLFFSLELPNVAIFERHGALANEIPQRDVRERYLRETPEPVNVAGSDHIYWIDNTSLTVDQVGLFIEAAKARDIAPDVVMIDYVGLMKALGNRYMAQSSIAEDLKALAKEHNVVLFIACQMGRKGRDDVGEIYLHDSRDSSSIEQSCQLFFGIWTSEDELTHGCKILKVVKQTRGKAGRKFTLLWRPEMMVMR